MESRVSVVATDACGWPNLIKLENGDLLCFYFNAPSHGLMEGDIVCSQKLDYSKRWRRVSTVSKRPKNGNRMHLAVGQAHNGDLLCFSSGFILDNGKLTDFAGHWLSRSKDYGKNWTEDRNPIIPNQLRNCIPYGRIIRLAKKGTLAYSCYKSLGKGKPSESWICFSYDDGITWNSFFKIGQNDSNEVSLCALPNETIIAAVRTHRDHHLKVGQFTLSKKRWKEFGPLTLPMQHPGDLIMFNSRCLLLTYGIRNRGLMGLGARISVDMGVTWFPPIVIHQLGDKAFDVGYPSTIRTDGHGNLLTSYYTNHEPLMGKTASRYRVLVKEWNIFDWMGEESKKAVLKED